VKNRKKEKLESCPVCGSRDVIIDPFFDVRDDTGNKYRVQCRNCRFATRWLDTEAGARELWNGNAGREAGAEESGVYSGLLYVPVSDPNFGSGIGRLKTPDLTGMLNRLRLLEAMKGGHKSRIKAVEKELNRRKKQGGE
jgi:hypothetical protein